MVRPCFISCMQYVQMSGESYYLATPPSLAVKTSITGCALGSLSLPFTELGLVRVAGSTGWLYTNITFRLSITSID